MLTEKDYCDYDTCVALKELDFNSLVDWYRLGNCNLGCRCTDSVLGVKSYFKLIEK